MAIDELQTTPEATKTLRYGDLKGANFTDDPSRVDRDNSPDLLNMISDLGGNPVKRKGWEIMQEFDDDILNLFQSNDKDWLFVVFKKSVRAVSISGIEPVSKTLTTPLSGPTTGYYMENGTSAYSRQSLFIITPDGLLECYIDSGGPAFSFPDPYIPTVIINRDVGRTIPGDGISGGDDIVVKGGGGATYEGINLLTRERIDSFYTDSAPSGTAPLTGILDSTKSWSVTFLDSDGVWKPYTGSKTLNAAKTIVTLGVLPEAPVNGEDNLRIQYFAIDSDSAGSKNKILKSQTSSHFDTGSMERVFVSGNPDYPQHIHYTDLGRPTHFPDLNYMVIGGSTTAVQGFLNIGESLGVVKESSNTNDPTIYILTSRLEQTGSVTTKGTDTDDTVYKNETKYEINQCATGIGAASKRCFATVYDEPMFLGEDGMYGVLGTSLQKEKVVRNRSLRLDGYLRKEDDLQNAVGVRWKNYYAVFVNSHVYLLDGRQKKGDKANNTDYTYEGYYWENVPASCVLAYKEELLFGNGSMLCRFKTSDDMESYSDNGSAIRAVWSTPNDNAGQTEMLKTMMKRGSLITLAPYKHSSCDAYYEADAGERTYIGTYYADISDLFEDVDFSKFSFDTRKGPRDYAYQKKIKKYKRLKLIFENKEVNEGFGIHEVIITYKDIKKVKK